MRDKVARGDHERSGVLALVRIFDRCLRCIRRRWELWMRSFGICGRGSSGGAGRANSLLDFLFTRRQRIVRGVQRALFYFDFDYALQRFDRIGYFLLVRRISELFDFDPSGHCFDQRRVRVFGFFLHVL